jgi:hypothetical protein
MDLAVEFVGGRASLRLCWASGNTKRGDSTFYRVRYSTGLVDSVHEGVTEAQLVNSEGDGRLSGTLKLAGTVLAGTALVQTLSGNVSLSDVQNVADDQWTDVECCVGFICAFPLMYVKNPHSETPQHASADCLFSTADIGAALAAASEMHGFSIVFVNCGMSLADLGMGRGVENFEEYLPLAATGIAEILQSSSLVVSAGEGASKEAALAPDQAQVTTLSLGGTFGGRLCHDPQIGGVARLREVLGGEEHVTICASRSF